jgi:Fe-S cluster biogenesis protein NfuA
MAQDTELQKKIQRIGTIVEQLETSADPNSRALARDLLESMMALHGAGLERILELAAEEGDGGVKLIEKCGRDELVSSLLLLYGLHPDDLATRVQRALEKTRPFLQSHAAQAELVSVREDGAVTVRLKQSASGCGSTAATVRSTVEAAIQDAAPDAKSVVVEQPGQPVAGFVSVAQLQSGQSMTALSASPLQRNGD